jgi:tetratricopeptide (TPR) repeat protein
MLSATRSGNAQFLEAQARAIGCQLRFWGDQSLADAAAHVGAELDWAEAYGYPSLAVSALGVLAQANALLGHGGKARDLISRAARLGEELVFGPGSAELAAQDAAAAAQVMLALGDPREAAAVLDRGERALGRIGAAGLRPWLLALSARARHRMGARQQAHELLDYCDPLAPADDVATQAAIRGTRALLLADEGDYFHAERLARSAVKISDWSERVDVQAQARADLATVLVRADRGREAALPAGWALHLFRRRGDVVSAAAVRDLLPDDQPGDYRPLRAEAWLMAAEPALVAGRTTEIGIRLHPDTDKPPYSYRARPDQSTEVLVTLVTGGEAAVQPNGRRLRLPRSGPTEPLTFRVTPWSPMPLRLHILINLYEEGTLLHELGVTIPVLRAELGEHSDGR